MGELSNYLYKVDYEAFLSDLIEHLGLNNLNKHRFISNCLKKIKK